MPSHETVELCLGNDRLEMEVTVYGYEYMSELIKGAPIPMVPSSITWPGEFHSTLQSGSHRDYEDVDQGGYIACVSHTYGVKDLESPGLWQEVGAYLKDGILLPCCESLREHK